jgi:hypothetical protein
VALSTALASQRRDSVVSAFSERLVLIGALLRFAWILADSAVGAQLEIVVYLYQIYA